MLTRRLKPGPHQISMPRVIDVLRLTRLLRRYPATLSGGEAQRVALGRAIAIMPDLLLLDEPCGTLDSESKQEVLTYFRQILEEYRLPAIVVTHDHELLQSLDACKVEMPQKPR